MRLKISIMVRISPLSMARRARSWLWSSSSQPWLLEGLSVSPSAYAASCPDTSASVNADSKGASRVCMVRDSTPHRPDNPLRTRCKSCSRAFTDDAPRTELGQGWGKAGWVAMVTARQADSKVSARQKKTGPRPASRTGPKRRTPGGPWRLPETCRVTLRSSCPSYGRGCRPPDRQPGRCGSSPPR